MLRTLEQVAKHGIVSEPAPEADDSLRVQDLLQREILDVLGRALCIRHVDAGLVQRVRAGDPRAQQSLLQPRRLGAEVRRQPAAWADMLLVTGPVSAHMEVALRRTYEATPEPKLVVAVGDCARDGGVFR